MKIFQSFSVILGAVVLVIGIGLIGMYFAFRPHLSMDSADNDMKPLLAIAGGSEKVCEEAAEIFHRFGITGQRPFSESELKDYPAIAALGQVDGIWAADPAFIKIRVGNHQNGYTIQIVDINGSGNYTESPNMLKVGSCIYVHR